MVQPICIILSLICPFRTTRTLLPSSPGPGRLSLEIPTHFLTLCPPGGSLGGSSGKRPTESEASLLSTSAIGYHSCHVVLPFRLPCLGSIDPHFPCSFRPGYLFPVRTLSNPEDFPFLKNLFYWSIVDLQYCVNFCCPAQWFSCANIYIHTHTHIHSFSYSFLLRSITGYWL